MPELQFNTRDEAEIRRVLRPLIARCLKRFRVPESATSRIVAGAVTGAVAGALSAAAECWRGHVQSKAKDGGRRKS